MKESLLEQMSKCNVPMMKNMIRKSEEQSMLLQNREGGIKFKNTE